MPISPPLQGLNRAFPSSVSPIDINDLSQPSLTSIPGVANTNMSAGGPPASPTPPDTDVALAVLQDRKQRQLSNELAAAQRPGVDGDVSGLRTLLSGNAGDFAQTQAAMQLDPSQQANTAAIAQGFKAPGVVQAPGMGNNVFGTAAPSSPQSPTPSMIPFGQNAGNYSPSQAMNMYPRQAAAIKASADMRDQAAQATQRIADAQKAQAQSVAIEADRANKAKLDAVEQQARIEGIKALARGGQLTGKAEENTDVNRTNIANEISGLQDPKSWQLRDYMPGMNSRAEQIKSLQNKMSSMNAAVNPNAGALQTLLGMKGTTNIPTQVKALGAGGTATDPSTNYNWAKHPDGSIWVDRGDGTKWQRVQ